MLPYVVFGDGPPLVVLRGFGFTHTNPRGRYRAIEAKPYLGIARERTVYLTTRAPGLATGSSMGDIATTHARALHAAFGKPVDVLGMSTGGSIALQLATDHPDAVRRLVVVASAYRLPERARADQAELADRLAAGRRGLHLLAGELTGNRMLRPLLRAGLWLVARRAQPRDASDAVTMLRAEDDFDVGDRLAGITCPTLVIGGDEDAAYGPAMFRATGEGVANGTLVLYPGRGHVATPSAPSFSEDVLRFLD